MKKMNDTLKAQIRQLLRLAATDPEVRAELLADPASALRRFAGVEIAAADLPSFVASDDEASSEDAIVIPALIARPLGSNELAAATGGRQYENWGGEFVSAAMENWGSEVI